MAGKRAKYVKECMCACGGGQVRAGMGEGEGEGRQERSRKKGWSEEREAVTEGGESGFI